MKKTASIIFATLLSIAPACYALPESNYGWVTLLDTSGGFDKFTTIGDASWVLTGQGVEAQDKRQKHALLMTKDVYEGTRLSKGHIGMQWGEGTVSFRVVKIKAL